MSFLGVCIDLIFRPTDLQSLGSLRAELEGRRTPCPNSPRYNGLCSPHRLGAFTAQT